MERDREENSNLLFSVVLTSITPPVIYQLNSKVIVFNSGFLYSNTMFFSVVPSDRTGVNGTN